MEQAVSPSPAPSNYLNQPDEDLSHGFQHLIQHNEAPTPYHQADQQQVDIGSNVGSNPHSRYSSPGPQDNMMDLYDHHTPINHASPYGAPPYPGGYQTAYPIIESTPYPQLPELGSSTTSHHAYSTPATSPPTPVPAEGMTTRSGRSLMRPSTLSTLTRPSRIERPAPKPRQKKRKVKDDVFPDPTGLALAEPLSKLVKDITTATDTNIQEYVTRSPDERRREVAQSKTGKVKRPMNAFMLYRKAYQNRTKEWKRLDAIRRKEESASEGRPEKGHDNHQVISQVCGLSWNMEPQELRDQYDEWAKIERNNHKLAFPDYKFAPAKSKIKKPGVVGGGAGRESGSRHGDRDSDDDNASNLDAYDFHEWGQSGSGPPSRNATRSRYHDLEGDYVVPQRYSPSVYTSRSPNLHAAHLPSAYAAHTHTQTHMHHPHPSSFQYSNPGKPRPAEYGSGLGHAQYYQQSTEFTQQSYPHHGGGITYGSNHHGTPAWVENVYINKANSPASSFHGSPVLDHHRAYNELILPSNSYASQMSHARAAILHSQPQHMARHPAEHQIDPLLMSAHQEAGVRGGAGENHIGQDMPFDSLEILAMSQSNEFAEGRSTYQLGQGIAGLGGSHTASPHPQQFEQAYYTPNDTAPATTTGEGGDTATEAVDSSWQDDTTSAADGKVGSSDWEAALGAATEFQLEDIDQILGTTTGSPGDETSHI
ncbi:hypothetical protein GGS21DRAFT_543451 [Xylaria nigripes]|nr:hypothetical protein GGS21DRAFT_543451 [Xylaria nigripes]